MPSLFVHKRLRKSKSRESGWAGDEPSVAVKHPAKFARRLTSGAACSILVRYGEFMV